MDEYGQLLPYFSGWIRSGLEAVPERERPGVREIRLRLGQPPVLVTGSGVRFLTENGMSPSLPRRRTCREDLRETLRRVCGYSMQSCQYELTRGFCTLPGGHRVGIAGTVAAEGGGIRSFREPLCLNFRIARQLPGAAGDLPQRLYSADRTPSVLLAGPPASGKTTVLRDMVRRLSAGEAGRRCQIAAVDERGELGGGLDVGEASLDLGPCTDLLSGYPKGAGMEIALRTLSPDILACDEIGGEEEAGAVLDSVSAGVPLLATIHGSSPEAVLRRPAMRAFREAEVFDLMVLLGGEPGTVRGIFPLKGERG